MERDTRDSLKRHTWNLEEFGIRELGHDKNPPYLSRYEELRNRNGVVLKRGFSASKPHHSRLSTPHIEEDMDAFRLDPTPESRPPRDSRYDIVVLTNPGEIGYSYSISHPTTVGIA